MLRICTIAGNSAHPVAPVRFRPAGPSYMMSAGPSAKRGRWRAAGLAAPAGGVVGAFAMGKMLALPLLTCLADRPKAVNPMAVGAAPG